MDCPVKTLSYSGSPAPSIHDRMPLALLASALQMLDKQGKAIDDTNGLLFFHWDPSAGPGVLSIENAEQEKSTVSMPLDGKDAPLPVVVSMPCVLRLAPEKFPGLTINVSANGSYKISQAQGAPKEEEEEEFLPSCLRWT